MNQKNVYSKNSGKHLLIGLFDCNKELIDDLDFVQEVFINASKEARAEVLSVSFRKFQPNGISGVVIISESHLTIHSWPEEGYCAIDIFTCGNKAKPFRALGYINKKLQGKKCSVIQLDRGNENNFFPSQILYYPNCESELI